MSPFLPGDNGDESESYNLQPAASGPSIPDLSAETLAAVREGLLRVVNDPNGTAYKEVKRGHH